MSLAATIVRQVVSADAALPLPPGDTSVTRTPWRSRWEFERGGRLWRVSVQASLPVEAFPGDENGEGLRAFIRAEGPIDSREWIESLGDEQRWPEGTRFEVVVEEVRDVLL